MRTIRNESEELEAGKFNRVRCEREEVERCAGDGQVKYHIEAWMALSYD